MSGYETDSSSNEDTSLSTTNVTLGYAVDESTGDEISHIGGFPTWLDTNHLPPATLSKCKICNGHMSLLLQLHADLLQHFPNDERRLHVLCCRKKTCSRKPGSIRAFREVRKGESRQDKNRQVKRSTTKVEEKPVQSLGSQLFGSPTSPSIDSNTNTNANPFSTTKQTSTSDLNPFSSIGSPSALAAKPPQQPVEAVQPPTESFTEKLRIDDQNQDPWPDDTVFPPAYPRFYLDAYPEELDDDPTTSTLPSAGPSTQYDLEDSKLPDKSEFESSLDKTFQKFSDRISQNPEQVLRYEFKGHPLLYSSTDDTSSYFSSSHQFKNTGKTKNIPKCTRCGNNRVFELQLVPGLIYELEKYLTLSSSKDVDMIKEGMDWGTIIVATCQNNCGEPTKISFIEEWVGVQWEDQ